MRGEFRGAGVDRFEGEVADVNVQAFAGTQDHAHYVKPQLVDEARGQILVRRGGTTAIATLRSLAASRARSRATSMPSPTKWQVVPPCIGTDARGLWVRT